MSLRVVNLGLPKTGTTTLARALRKAGFRVADQRIRPKQISDKELHNQYVADLLYRGYFETGDPGAFLAPFTALTEICSPLARAAELSPLPAQPDEHARNPRAERPAPSAVPQCNGADESPPLCPSP